MKLKVKTHLTHHIDANDLNLVARIVLSKNFDFERVECVVPESVIHFADINNDLTPYDKANIDRWQKGTFVPYTAKCVLKYLVSLDKAPAGDYIVHLDY